MVAGIAHEINTPVGIALTGITHIEEEVQNVKIAYNNDEITDESFNEFLDDSISLTNSIKINLQKAAELVKSFKKVALTKA